MATTNFAQGYGSFPLVPHMPYAAFSTPYGVQLPPGARVVGYVRSTRDSTDPPEIDRRRFSTINEALAQCRSGKGDVVYVLPGHTENVSAADKFSNLVAGTKIIGLGVGSNRPTLTWTAAAATVLLDVADVVLSNFNLVMASTANGGVTVAAGLTMSGNGCVLEGCKIDFGADADDIVTLGVVISGDDCVFANNECVGATAAECTTFLQLVGADRAKLLNNRIVGATSNTGVGLVRFLTTASTDVMIRGLHVRNNKAASTIAITGLASCSGDADNLFMVVLSDGAGALTGAFATPASFVFGRQCYVANTIAERAALFGTESA